MFWVLVVVGSLSLSGYFLFSNLETYKDSTTTVNLYDPQVKQNWNTKLLFLFHFRRLCKIKYSSLRLPYAVQIR